MDRRTFLGTAAAIAVLGRPARAAARSLAMPPLRDTTATGRVEIAARPGRMAFGGGADSATMGFDQPYLGPTIRMRAGSTAARLGNALDEEVSVHWHGLLVPGHQDGGPHSAIAPGGVWDGTLDFVQPPATLWYHSHAHGRTARHVHAGLAGMLQITDGRDADRGLPSDYGVDDLPVIIQDRRFDAQGRSHYDPSMTDILNGFHGDRILVNGQRHAVAVVPRGIVRLRFLNGSNARVYTLHMQDLRPMHLIATDGGFLPAPVPVTYLRLATGERAEVLVDFDAAAPPVLMSNKGTRMRILDFAVDDRMPARIRRVPDTLDALADDLPREGVPARRFTLNLGGGSVGAPMAHGGHSHAHAVEDFGINGRPFRMDRIDFALRRGAVERWVIGGGGAVDHPFHVHGVQFRVLREGGGMRPRPENSGWKDTVLVSGETEVLMRFDVPAPDSHPYMFHCHILEHEDAGMMGQFTVG